MKLTDLMINMRIGVNSLHQKLHLFRVVFPIGGSNALSLQQAFVKPEFDFVWGGEMFVQVSQVFPFLLQNFMYVKGGVDVEIGGGSD